MWAIDQTGNNGALWLSCRLQRGRNFCWCVRTEFKIIHTVCEDKMYVLISDAVNLLKSSLIKVLKMPDLDNISWFTPTKPQSLHYLHVGGLYRKVSVQIKSLGDTVLGTNHALFTLSENRMSTLPSDNSPEDANHRSFWMVRWRVCVSRVLGESRRSKPFCRSGINQPE